MRILFLVVSCLLLVVSQLGCGQTNNSGSSTTTTLPTQTISISGTLSLGTITSSSIKAAAAAGDYKVVAINHNTGKAYAASPNSSGGFSLTLPNNVSYEVSLINESTANYFGPVVMVGNTSSSEVVVGITPTANTNLGQIVIDTTQKFAKPTAEPIAIANALDKAVATSGVPKGVGNYGKTTLSGITTVEGSDMDKDGIPNLFDADEDNDGKMNGTAILPTSSTVVSNTIESVFMSSNIWANHGTTEEAKDQIAMWLNVKVKTGKLNEIASIEVINVPATIKDIATVRFSSSIGSPEGYPAENSRWKTSGYKLYKTTTLSNNQWIISLCPKAVMGLGDTFTLRVYFTAGGYEDYYISMSYVLTDWAKIITYNNGTTLLSTEGTNANPRTFSSSSLELAFSKPKDEDGNTLAGLRYSVQVGTSELDASSGTYKVADPNIMVETAVTDSGADTLSFTFSSITAECYYVTPVAESADGQRNGEQTWFKKL